VTGLRTVQPPGETIEERETLASLLQQQILGFTAEHFTDTMPSVDNPAGLEVPIQSALPPDATNSGYWVALTMGSAGAADELVNLGLAAASVVALGMVSQICLCCGAYWNTLAFRKPVAPSCDRQLRKWSDAKGPTPSAFSCPLYPRDRRNGCCRRPFEL